MPSSDRADRVNRALDALRTHESGRSSPPPGAPQLARFEIHETLGEGGAAIVYRARDLQLGREIALKVLRETLTAHPTVRERFQREAKVAANLSHPNLIAVHDAGEGDGRLFLVMEYVAGRSLQRILADRELGLDARVALIEKAARGVAAAHARGVIHRDLKPANILVTEQGEPKVADFGLAHIDGSEAAFTRTGTVMGTPLYMAPEQVRGRPDELSPRTDVFALGAILYEALTGKAPHAGASVTEIYGAITGSDPLPPRRLNPKVPLDLETIALKALEKEPARRYASAAEFADELARHLAGEPVHARPVSAASRFWRHVRKRRAFYIPTAVAVLLALALAGVFVSNAVSAKRILEDALVRARDIERSGPVEGARDAWRRALDLDGGSAEARAGLGRAEAAIATARADHDRALMLVEESRPALEAAMRSVYRAGNDFKATMAAVERAQAPLREAVEKAPRHAPAHYLSGLAWELRGYDDKAEECYRAALALDSRYGAAHFRLSRILLVRSYLTFTVGTGRSRADRIRKADAMMDEVLKEIEASFATPNAFDNDMQRQTAKITRAYMAGDKEQMPLILEAIRDHGSEDGAEELYWMAAISAPHAERQKYLDDALKRHPNYWLALYSQAVLHHVEGRLDEAIKCISRAIEVHPRCTAMLVFRGDIRRNQQRWTEGEADYTQALGIDPVLPQAHYGRGICRRNLGDVRGAIEDMDIYIRSEATDAEGYFQRGSMRSLIPDRAGALADYDESIRLDPAATVAHVNRGTLREQMGDLKGALADLEEALRNAPADWEFRGTTERRRDRVKAALEGRREF